jgi:chromosome segregation ATPase
MVDRLGNLENANVREIQLLEDTHRMNIASLNELVEEKEKEIRALKAQLERAQATIGENENAIAKLRWDIERGVQQLESLRQSIQSAGAESNQRGAELDMLRREVADKEVGLGFTELSSIVP